MSFSNCCCHASRSNSASVEFSLALGLLNLGWPCLLCPRLRQALQDSSDLEHQTDIPPSDSEIRLCIKDVMDKSNQGGRRIRSLQHISFAYKSTDPADTTPDPACNPAKVVNVVGFVHGTESILDTTMRSWIEDPCVIDQQRTPVSILQGSGGNWRQHDIILAFFSDCERGPAPAWTGCAPPTRQHRLQRGDAKKAAPTPPRV